MSKKELERRHREEQEATAHAFQEFIKTFQDVSGPPNKLFVRSGILNAKSGKEENSDKGKIYNPSAVIKSNSNTLKNALECARLLKENKLERSKNSEKPKSNLELLKEELRQRHMERDVRNKYREEILGNDSYNENTDDTTTNLFVANINPKLMEQDLMQIFGAFGPLASVKIMWPRNDEVGRNSSNCGFVAFMSRKDCERALKALKNRDDMRIGWGKPVEVPPNPIYIPPELVKMLLPPPYTGLPFNAQPLKQPFDYPRTEEEMKELLYNSVVKVTIPQDKKSLYLIHRMIEFVINEGPIFEAFIMNKEINNPSYKFLFDNTTALHVYYRWKMYSILQGDSLTNWSTKKFRMFEGGSIWIPPVIPNYTEGMPDFLVKNQNNFERKLSEAQKSRLIQFIQNLTTSKKKIGEAMVFCLNHLDAVSDISELIYSSFENSTTKPTKKIARLYLISDILYNSTIKSLSNGKYKSEFMKRLPAIFEHLQKSFEILQTNCDKDNFKAKVFKVLRAWDLWKIYPNEFLNRLDTIFSGSTVDNENIGEDSGADEPLDGKNLIKRSLKNSNNCNSKKENNCVIVNKEEIISKTNLDSQKDKAETIPLPGFIPSKWETIDPDVVEAQAMSTKKFYDLEIQRKNNENEQKKKGSNLDKQERERLRQIEVMVMQYQDEIESGKHKLKRGKSLECHLSEYRNHLLDKMKRDILLKGNENLSPISSNSSSEEDKTDRYRNKSYSKKKSKERYQKRRRN